MLHVWIPVFTIPKSERPYTCNSNVCINIDDACKFCNDKHDQRVVGNGSQCSFFIAICEHYKTWELMWANRIIPISNGIVFPNIDAEPGYVIIKSRSKVIDPANDGCRCTGCDNWFPMAESNQIDNTFKCFSCRN